MTNEELTVLKDLITDDLISRKSAECFASKSREDKNKCDLLTKERERLMAECNRLLESEANALNAAEEAKRERDEVKKELGEWVRFINDTIYIALVKAVERKDCRKIVNDAVNAMRKFIFEHPVEVIKGELEK